MNTYLNFVGYCKKYPENFISPKVIDIEKNVMISQGEEFNLSEIEFYKFTDEILDIRENKILEGSIGFMNKKVGFIAYNQDFGFSFVDFKTNECEPIKDRNFEPVGFIKFQSSDVSSGIYVWQGDIK